MIISGNIGEFCSRGGCVLLSKDLVLSGELGEFGEVSNVRLRIRFFFLGVRSRLGIGIGGRVFILGWESVR